MKMFSDVSAVYLHREPVDVRKSMSGLSVIVENDTGMSPLSGALYVFMNRSRDKLKLFYWDRSGFALFHKRLVQDKFHWPRPWPEASLNDPCRRSFVTIVVQSAGLIDQKQPIDNY